MIRRLLNKSTFLASVAMCSLIISAQCFGGTQATLRFALSDKHGFPDKADKTHFDCSDKIYSVTEVSGLTKGKHVVSFEWIDPSSDLRENTTYDFYVRDESSTKLWAWLELSRATGAGMLQWLNPAAGLEEFIGEWDVNIVINDKKYKSSSFEVSC